MSLIELNNITKSYGDKTIFKDFSLKVEGGDFIALTGDSGCGKSTLLNIIGLLEEFDSGEIIIDGKTSPSLNSRVANKILREKISYLFQNFALVDEETVEYNLKLACKYVKANRHEKEFSISEALKHVGLKGYEKRKIYELSGGEQQRVAIARIMLKPSKIILADEPTGSLDEKNRDVVLNLLKTLNKEGKTLILVTHDKYVASQCDKIIHLTP